MEDIDQKIDNLKEQTKNLQEQTKELEESRLKDIALEKTEHYYQKFAIFPSFFSKDYVTFVTINPKTRQFETKYENPETGDRFRVCGRETYKLDDLDYFYGIHGLINGNFVSIDYD